jgi:hypothetical protein
MKEPLLSQSALYEGIITRGYFLNSQRIKLLNDAVIFSNALNDTLKGRGFFSPRSIYNY